MDLPDGYAARAATTDDVTALWRLVCAVDVEEYGVPDYDESDVADHLARDRFDLARDTWVVESPGKEVVAYADAWDKDPHALVVAESFVHPDAPDLYPWTVERVTARAAEHAATSGRVVVHAYGAATNARRNAALTAAGYANVRAFRRMNRSLDDLPPIPAGTSVRRADDVRLAYEIQQAAFAGHYDFAPMTYAAWRRQFVETASYCPEHWWLAEHDGHPVGALIGQVHDGERGFVKSLGVLSGARGRGVGTALLLTAFHAFRDAGLTNVGLGVDAGNETGAVALYERLGMTAAQRYDTYELVLTNS